MPVASAGDNGDRLVGGGGPVVCRLPSRDGASTRITLFLAVNRSTGREVRAVSQRKRKDSGRDGRDAARRVSDILEAVAQLVRAVAVLVIALSQLLR